MNIFESSSGRTGYGYRTTLVPGQYVTVERIVEGQVVSVKRFEVGDEAEYDSFNLSYTGPIMSITAKSIIVKDSGGVNRRLKPEVFAWRNWDFDSAETARKNAETSMYI